MVETKNQALTVAHVQLGKLAEDSLALETARKNGKEPALTNARDFETLPMWKFRKNWVPDEALGKELIVKIQVPLDGSPEDSMCMMYDEKRMFSCNISKQNCPEFLSLLNVISTKGSAGGFKAYFPAKMPTKADGQMTLDLNGLEAKMPW